MTDESTSRRARTLAAALEPFAGQVYFSPECHAGYEALGFGPSPAQVRGVAMPDGAAYFCSRGSVLGQVPGTVVAAAFGVFNPAVVAPAVDHGWRLTDAPTIAEARTAGALAQLHRVLDGRDRSAVDAAASRVAAVLGPVAEALPVAGHPLFAGLLHAPVPADPLGVAWRQADRLREFRGDAHIAAWTAAGFDAVEIGLLTELYWGLPLKTYVRTRAWSDAELDAGVDRLEAAGLVAGGALTGEGRARREAVEAATDRQCRPLIEAVGDAFDEVVGDLQRLSRAVRDGHGYPASGPHDLADAAAR